MTPPASVDAQCHTKTGDVHPQLQSPLFAKLPSEIRNVIWTFCVLEYDDVEHPYLPNTHYCRPPDFTHHRILDTSVLRTCRAIYEESKELPASVNTLVLWQSYQRRPPTLYRRNRPRPSIPWDDQGGNKLDAIANSTMRTAPSHLIRRLHIFAQQLRLEWWLSVKDNYLPRYANIEHLTITLRRSDWLKWELDAPLVLDPRCESRSSATDMLEVWRRASEGQSVGLPEESWARMIGKFRRLNSFELELETSKEKESELRAIIAQAQTWTFLLEGTSRTLKSGVRKSEWRYWQGPKCLNTLADQEKPEGPELVVAKVFYRMG